MSIDKDLMVHRLKQCVGNALQEHEQGKDDLESKVKDLQSLISEYEVKIRFLNDQIAKTSELLVCLDKLLE
jgi:peptidoglycan hydrolase CwlO-like protein